MVEILPSSRSSISVKQSASCNAIYNIIREELALVKQNGAWKPRRKKGWSGLFYPPNGLNFQFCWFNLIFLIAPSWSESNFILLFYSIRVGPSRSELIRVKILQRGLSMVFYKNRILSHGCFLDKLSQKRLFLMFLIEKNAF